MSLPGPSPGIVLPAFEGKAPFGAETRRQIRALKEAFGLDLTAEDSHRLMEGGPGVGQGGRARGGR